MTENGSQKILTHKFLSAECIEGGCRELTLQAEIDRLEKLVYVPGLWQCAKCTFQLLQGTIHANSGAITPRDQTGEICPRCETPLWRVTERDAGNRLASDLDKVIADRETMREQLEAGPIAELEALIVRIDALTLPPYTTDYDRHRDAISRAGIKTEIGHRISELRGQPRPALSAADALVGAARMINAAALQEVEDKTKQNFRPDPEAFRAVLDRDAAKD